MPEGAPPCCCGEEQGGDCCCDAGAWNSVTWRGVSATNYGSSYPQPPGFSLGTPAPIGGVWYAETGDWQMWVWSYIDAEHCPEPPHITYADIIWFQGGHYNFNAECCEETWDEANEQYELYDDADPNQIVIDAVPDCPC